MIKTIYYMQSKAFTMGDFKLKALIFALTLALLDLILPTSSSLLDCAAGKKVACFRDSKIRKNYDGFDQFLRGFGHSGEPKVIMGVFEDWIRRESVRTLNSEDAIRLKALVQLHNLAPTDGPGRCNPSTSRILEDNDQALRGALSKLEPGQVPERPIEQLVQYYAEKFIEECDYEKVLHEFDEDSLQFIRTIVGEYVGTRARDELKFPLIQGRVANPSKFIEQQPANAKNYAKTMKGIRPQRDAAIIYRLLAKVSYENFDPMGQYLKKVRKTPNDKAEVDNQKVFKLYRKYIGKPCERFVERVESSFGSKWARAQSAKLHKKQGNEAELDKNLAYFYGCQLILRNEGTLVDELRDIVRQA